MKIGVIVQNFGLSIKEGIKLASDLGADGVQLWAIAGETAPENLDASGRRDLKNLVESHGLTFSALFGDFGGHGFERSDELDWRIEGTKKAMDLARDLGTDVTTTHLGVLPEDTSDERYQNISTACRALGEYGEKIGIRLAIETGPETAAQLGEFIETLNNPMVCVNYDPANLVMVTGDDPVAGVRTLAKHIVHTHAKDGIKTGEESAEVIYGWFADGGIEDVRLADYFVEKPLGQGSVDWPAYLDALREIGYEGFFTIEREVGEDPVGDIRHAVSFLRSFDY